MAIKMDDARFRKLLLSHPEKAIELLYDAYYKRLLIIAHKLTKDSEMAEDIVQEVFLSIWLNNKRLSQNHEMPIEHYLVKAVRYKSISAFKRKIKDSIELQILSKNYPFPWRSSATDAGIIELEMVCEIRKLISNFPLKERECLLMKMDKEMSVDQIATVQNVTRKAVERSLTSAYKRLRKYLKSR